MNFEEVLCKQLSDNKQKQQQRCVNMFHTMIEPIIDKYTSDLASIRQYALAVNTKICPIKKISLAHISYYIDEESYLRDHVSVYDYDSGYRDPKEDTSWTESLLKDECITTLIPYANLYLQAKFRNQDIGEYSPKYGKYNWGFEIYLERE